MKSDTEFQRVFKGFDTIRYEASRRRAGLPETPSGEEQKKAFTGVYEGAATIRHLVREHLRAVERSVE